MPAEKSNPPVVEAGGGETVDTKAGTLKILPKAGSGKRVIRAIVHDADGNERAIVAVGRPAWLLDSLIHAGEKGVTPIEASAGGWCVRCSHYCHILRRRHGLLIETVDERHGPPFAGIHSPLRCRGGAS